MPAGLDSLHIVLAAAAGLLILVLLWLLRTLGRAGRRLAELEAKAGGGGRQEYRIARFDVLWFPTVSFSAAAKSVTGVAPGLPHCSACVQPLALGGGVWRCPKCSQQYPESLVDVHVTDTVSKLALGYFKERHPDFGPASGRQ